MACLGMVRTEDYKYDQLQIWPILGFACFCHLKDLKVNTWKEDVVEKENSQPITSWHIILPNQQNATNYKAPRTTTRFCYHYSKTNRNLPSVIEIGAWNACKNQSHISACKWWHKQRNACKRWHKQSNRALTCVTLKIKTFQPIKQCHVSWRKSLKSPSNQTVTHATNQTLPRVAHPPPDSYK